MALLGCRARVAFRFAGILSRKERPNLQTRGGFIEKPKDHDPSNDIDPTSKEIVYPFASRNGGTSQESGWHESSTAGARVIAVVRFQQHERWLAAEAVRSCQSGTRQTRLELVVSEVYVGRYDARRARKGIARGTERIVGGSGTSAAAGVRENQEAWYKPRQSEESDESLESGVSVEVCAVLLRDIFRLLKRC